MQTLAMKVTLTVSQVSKSLMIRDQNKRKGGNRRAPPVSLKVHQKQMPLRKQATMKEPLPSVRYIRGCFNCGDLTHRKSDCKKPSQPGKPQVKKVKNNDVVKCGVANYENRYVIPVYINDRECTALRDTGANVTLVSKQFLTKEGIHTSGKIMPVENVFGDARPIETVQVMISSPRFGDPSQVLLEAGVVDYFKDIDLIVGHDVFMKFKNLKDPAGDFNHPSFSTDEQASVGNCSSVAVATRKQITG